MNTTLKNGHNRVATDIEPGVRQPDPQVTVRPTRRRFTAAEKLRILAEAEACNQPGQLGALLRREGLYSSSLISFRKQRDAGKLAKAPDQLRQQQRDKEAARQRDARRIAQLEAENKKLTVLLELQKKVAELFHLSLDNPTPE